MILAISPHADDVEWGAGALLAAEPAALIYLATGDDPERWSEARAGAEALQATIVRGPASDGQVAGAEDRIRADIEALVDAHRPDVVLLPPEADTHQDHRAARRAAMSALRRRALTIVEYETPSAPPEWAANCYAGVALVDVDAAVRALGAHHATQGWHRYMAPDLTRARLLVAGARVGLDYAVPLRYVRGLTPRGPQ